MGKRCRSRWQERGARAQTQAMPYMASCSLHTSRGRRLVCVEPRTLPTGEASLHGSRGVELRLVAVRAPNLGRGLLALAAPHARRNLEPGMEDAHGAHHE